MNKLAYRYLPASNKKKGAALTAGSGDLFVASVINQKAVSQNAQQVLVAIAIQVAALIEAQFGFAANDDSDVIDA